MLNRLNHVKKASWEILRSPKTLAFIKLGVALVGVVHAIDEFREASKSGGRPIGFRIDQD
jgi:hypothetical protein